MHDNLIHYFPTRHEAYKLLVDHQKRDERRLLVVLFLIFAIIFSHSEGWFLVADVWRVVV